MPDDSDIHSHDGQFLFSHSAEVYRTGGVKHRIARICSGSWDLLISVFYVVFQSVVQCGVDEASQRTLNISYIALSTIQHNHTPIRPGHWPYDLDFQYQATYDRVPHTYKTQLQMSVGLKDRVETDGRTDGQTDAVNCHSFPANMVGNKSV